MKNSSASYYAQFKALLCLGSHEKSMNKPLWVVTLLITSLSEYPIPCPAFIFHYVIISVLALFNPPFLLYSFRAICFFYIVQFPFVPEKHRRIVGYRYGYFDCFGGWQQVYWPFGRPGLQFVCGFSVKERANLSRPFRPINVHPVSNDEWQPKQFYLQFCPAVPLSLYHCRPL